MTRCKRSTLFRAALAVSLGNALWFLWTRRFVPVADFPEWEFQGWILSRFLRGPKPVAYSLKPYPVPHSITTLLGALLDLAVTPETSGKIILTIAIIAFAFSSIYLLKALGGTESSPLFLVPLLFIFNSFFFWGEIDYYIGCAAFCTFAGFILRRRGKLSGIRPCMVFWALCAVFEMHLLPYFCSLAVCGAIAMGHREFGLRKLLLPSIASGSLVVWYAVEHLSGCSAQTLWIPWTPRLMARSVIDALSVFHIFLPWCDYSLALFQGAAVINILVIVCMASLLFFVAETWRRGQRGDEDVVLAIALMVVGYLAGYQITGADMGERFLIPVLWLVMAWLAPRWNVEQASLATFSSAGVLAILLAQTVYVDCYAGSVSAHVAEAYKQLAGAQSQQQFCAMYISDVAASWWPQRPHGLARFLPNHTLVVCVPYYLGMERGKDMALMAAFADAGMIQNAGWQRDTRLCPDR